MRRVLLILSVVLLGALLPPPSTLHALTPATGCQWLYSAGGVGQFANLFVDPDATPLPNLRFGAAFVESSHIARNGLLDFDGVCSEGAPYRFAQVDATPGARLVSLSPMRAQRWGQPIR